MTLKAEEYTRKAGEAEAEAARVTDHIIKQAYLEVARQWREIAARAAQKR